MTRFVKGIKNSQRIRVLILDNATKSDFGVYTTVKDVFEGSCFVRELHRTHTVETLEQLSSARQLEGCTGIVWGFYDCQVQVDLV